MGDFNNFLDNSRNHNNFFDDLLNFNNFWNLHHFLNNLIDVDSDFLDSLNSSWDFDYFLDYDLDRIVLSDVVVDWLFNLNYFVHFHDPVNKFFNLDNLGNINSFHDHLSDCFGNPHDSLNNYWYLDSSVNYFLHFLYQSRCVVNHLVDLFDSVLVNDFFSDYLNNLNSRHLDLNLHYFLNSLWNFHNLFNHLNDRNWLLDFNFDNFWNRFDVVDNLSSVSVLN